jgi:hypothetical protein
MDLWGRSYELWERLTCIRKRSGFWNTFSYKVMIKTLKIPWGTPCRCPSIWVPHGILQVFIIILYEYVFQNPELFHTQVSLSQKQSTLDGQEVPCLAAKTRFRWVDEQANSINWLEDMMFSVTPKENANVSIGSVLKWRTRSPQISNDTLGNKNTLSIELKIL